MRFYFMMVLVLVSVLSVPVAALAQDNARLTLELRDLPSRATSNVDISIDKNSLNWALQGLKSKGADADQVRDIMKELESLTVKILEFEDETKAPKWDDLLLAARGALKTLDGPRWQSIVSITEKQGDSPSIVRVSVFKAAAGESGGAAVLVVGPEELVFINLVGKAGLDQLDRLGKAIGQPGLLGAQGGKSSSKSK
jgi:hypothetical protein